MNLELKFAILKSGRRQWEIAGAIGISEHKLSKVITGREKLKEEYQYKLAKELGVVKEEIFPKP